jgi:hypothetical protein
MCVYVKAYIAKQKVRKIGVTHHLPILPPVEPAFNHNGPWGTSNPYPKGMLLHLLWLRAFRSEMSNLHWADTTAFISTSLWEKHIFYVLLCSLDNSVAYQTFTVYFTKRKLTHLSSLQQEKLRDRVFWGMEGADSVLVKQDLHSETWTKWRKDNSKHGRMSQMTHI